MGSPPPGGSAAAASGSGPVAIWNRTRLTSTNIQFLNQHWHHGGRGREGADNAIWHTNKHGKGRSPMDYTRAALQLLATGVQNQVRGGLEITDGAATGRFTKNQPHRIYNFRD